MALNRSNYPVLIDANALAGIANAENLDLVRVDKSTIYELAANPQTETYAYIDAADDSTEVTGYQKSMAQEITLNEKNRCFQLIDTYFWDFKTGADTIVPCVLAKPIINTDGTVDKTKWKAKCWKEATLVGDSLNTVDRKYNFTINLNGDATDGYVVKNADGKFVFTEQEPVTPSVPDEGGEEVETFSLKSSKATSSK